MLLYIPGRHLAVVYSRIWCNLKLPTSVIVYSLRKEGYIGGRVADCHRDPSKGVIVREYNVCHWQSKYRCIRALAASVLSRS